MSNDYNFSINGSTNSGFGGSLFTLPAGASSSTTATQMPSTLGGISGDILSGIPSSASAIGSSILGSSNPIGSLFSSSSNGTTGNATDFRVRIRPQPAAQAQILGPGGGVSGSSSSPLNSISSNVLGSVGTPLGGLGSMFSSSSASSIVSSALSGTSSNIMNILYDTNGFMFPYTPTIEWNQQVRYEELSYVHSNQDYYAYKNTPSTEINISGAFTLQNQREGEYMIACMHFLRTVSKMYFGQASAGTSSNPGNAGMPPPVLLLSGYGDFMFNDLPVIVLNHSYTFPNDIDYVTVQVAGGKVRLPSILNITVHLVVQHTAQDMRTKFDLDKFRTGQLMKSKGWI